MTTEYTMGRIGNEDTFLKLDKAKLYKYVRLKSPNTLARSSWKMGKKR